ncbi:hypothetical protein NEHOM01_1240 [Nematocida homosporus]|uniref:uncharacterized protein n=1 Tax=Nematocida homosporus TaxID=1912981 RepID=UPI00221ECE8C|nr:uncharacterized protein NEHOM01_1240 [Nematocida homosporus]KAI5186037.1 hypothetical protein NEHOM01_1240 [Nematocida homosporus]
MGYRLESYYGQNDLYELDKKVLDRRRGVQTAYKIETSKDGKDVILPDAKEYRVYPKYTVNNNTKIYDMTQKEIKSLYDFCMPDGPTKKADPTLAEKKTELANIVTNFAQKETIEISQNYMKSQTVKKTKEELKKADELAKVISRSNFRLTLEDIDNATEPIPGNVPARITDKLPNWFLWELKNTFKIDTEKKLSLVRLFLPEPKLPPLITEDQMKVMDQEITTLLGQNPINTSAAFIDRNKYNNLSFREKQLLFRAIQRLPDIIKLDAYDLPNYLSSGKGPEQRDKVRQALTHIFTHEHLGIRLLDEKKNEQLTKIKKLKRQLIFQTPYLYPKLLKHYDELTKIHYLQKDCTSHAAYFGTPYKFQVLDSFQDIKALRDLIIPSKEEPAYNRFVILQPPSVVDSDSVRIAAEHPFYIPQLSLYGHIAQSLNNLTSELRYTDEYIQRIHSLEDQLILAKQEKEAAQGTPQAAAAAAAYKAKCFSTYMAINNIYDSRLPRPISFLNQIWYKIKRSTHKFFLGNYNLLADYQQSPSKGMNWLHKKMNSLNKRSDFLDMLIADDTASKQKLYQTLNGSVKTLSDVLDRVSLREEKYETQSMSALMNTLLLVMGIFAVMFGSIILSDHVLGSIQIVPDSIYMQILTLGKGTMLLGTGILFFILNSLIHAMYIYGFNFYIFIQVPRSNYFLNQIIFVLAVTFIAMLVSLSTTKTDQAVRSGIVIIIASCLVLMLIVYDHAIIKYQEMNSKDTKLSRKDRKVRVRRKVTLLATLTICLGVLFIFALANYTTLKAPLLAAAAKANNLPTTHAPTITPLS